MPHALVQSSRRRVETPVEYNIEVIGLKEDKMKEIGDENI